ncbi:helix-turn-helix transcriptional regulator [Mumia flava]|uniref:helix-turn-helix transcriptional regulator n=1 Tax=Mumia flava TaxID=1348852 RepID=UPI0012FD08DA|nr:LuxR C-terminal-related transcriptional regulator [Mumia flava]
MAAAGPPHYASTFVGREGEIEDMRAALGSGVLVTLLGPGGVGKTRLAAMLATATATEGVDPCWVELGPARSFNDVVDAVGAAVGAPTSRSDPLASVVAAMTGPATLLVLDECEHVAAHLGRLVHALRAGDAPRFLATSRVRLGIEGERPIRLLGLRPDEAVALFTDRVGALSEVTVAPGPVRQMCDRIDRLPLALELAAGWATTLSVEEIAARVREPLDLLADTPGPSFHLEGLESSIRRSHDLLESEHQVVFRRLSVFRAGFTAEQAQSVCCGSSVEAARVVPALRRLVDASLLSSDTTGPVARYHLLHTIHAVAAQRLAEAGEEDEVRRRHVTVMLDLLESAAPLREKDKDLWRSVVAAEYSNLSWAIEQGLAGPAPVAARTIAAHLGWWWHLESHRRDGLRLARAAIEAGAGERTPLHARVLLSAALAADTADPLHAPGWAAEAAQAARVAGDGESDRLARTLEAVYVMWRDLDEATLRATALQAEATARGDRLVQHASAVLLGVVAYLRDDYRRSTALLPDPCAALVATGDRGIASTGLAYLALARARSGDLITAEADARRACSVAEPLRDLHRRGVAAASLAEVLALQGRLDEATAVMRPVQDVLDRLPDPVLVPGWERTAARVSLWSGNIDDCLQWCEREAAWWGRLSGLGDDVSPETRVIQSQALRVVGRFEDARVLVDGVLEETAQGRFPRARAAACAERGHLLVAEDDDAAFEAFHESLAVADQIGAVLGCVTAVESLARLLPGRGSADLAVVLVAATAAARDTIGFRVDAGPPPDVEPDPALVARGKGLGLAAVELARRMRGTRTHRPSSGWGSLTPTEETVVALAVQGLTNPEIGTRLFISRGTVKTHLAHVYAKLGVSNRTALAAYVESTRGREESQ